MKHVLEDMKGLFVYMDDLLIYSKDEKEDFKTLEIMFKRLEEAGLAISPKKCLFGVEKLEFRGCAVACEGITPLSKSLDAI